MHKIRAVACITEKGVIPSLDSVLDQLEITEEIKPGKSISLLFWNILSSSLTSKGVTHSLLLTGCNKEVSSNGGYPHDAATWSIHLCTDFVRHSFSLPVSQLSQSFVACLLTMHEHADTIYLVLQEDTAPRVCIQNLTMAHFQVVESGVAAGLDACPQRVPAHHEVVYEPPSLAKLYPVVYDEDVGTERDKRLQQAAKNLKMKLRFVHFVRNSNKTGVDGDIGGDLGVCQKFEDWSGCFLLSCDEDKVLDVPGFGRVLVSVDSRVQHHAFISLLPTSGSPYQKLTSRLGVMAGQSMLRILKCELNLAQVVVSLCDDTEFSWREIEIVRFVANNVHFFHSNFSQDAARVDLTVKTLRVDNMMKQSSEEFAVAFLSRYEHAAPWQLVEQEYPPLLNFVVHYNPRGKFLITSILLSIQPTTVQLEDSLLQKLKNIVATYRLPQATHRDLRPIGMSFVDFSIPLAVLQEAERDAYPVTISNLVIEPISIFVSANITLKAYLSCKDTPFSFPRYELVGVFSTWPEISQMIAARYMSALFMHIGWVLGSLELIGSPVAFIQSINRGLMDLVRLPYEGLTRSPGLFVLGIGHGTLSFFRQFSSGALTSVTNLASSIARNMERLSMDSDHMTYQDRQRRERPTTHFTEGVAQGASSFVLSLMSAVAGLVEQPMQSIHQMDESAGTTTTLLKGVGKGLLGVVTKPVGGAMDLVSKTGQGIMRGTGLVQKLEHCELLGEVSEFARLQERKELVKTLGGYAR